MTSKQIKINRLNKIAMSIVALLLFTGLSYSQDTSIDYFEWRTSNLTEEDSDRLALLVITPAYIARFYENYLPWWQADILAFSTVALWEVKDGLIPEEKQKFLGGKGFSTEDLKLGVIGIGINRVLPIIVKTGMRIIHLPPKDNLAISFDTKSYPKLAWSIKF